MSSHRAGVTDPYDPRSEYIEKVIFEAKGI